MDHVVPDALLARRARGPRVAADLADVVASLDEHAARAAGGVVDAHSWLRFDDLDQRPHDICWGVELACLLARGVGEILDQVFVGRSEQVWELEILIAERDLLEVLDEVGQGIVVESALTDLAVEIDALEHILKRIDVRVFQGFQCLVQGPVPTFSLMCLSAG